VTGWAPSWSPSLRIITNLCCQFIQATLCAFYEIAPKSVRAKHVRSLNLTGASVDITIDCLVMGAFRSST
ncbi:hypothetical protein DJ83_18280, partial [Halorubrum ezzemoulense]